MTLDAMHLGVPDLLEDEHSALGELQAGLAKARMLPVRAGLEQALNLLTRLNRCGMTLLERQRGLQSLISEYPYYSGKQHEMPAPEQLMCLCAELANGFKRLVQQLLQGRTPSRPHLAWCLYMAEHFLAQHLLLHYQSYREAPESLWQDAHLLYWLGEQHECLDEPVAAAFQPTPADSLRGLYQQMLLMALSNPFHLIEGGALELFSGLAPLAGLARLLPWDSDDDSNAPVIDLTLGQPWLPADQATDCAPYYLRRLELGALLLALQEPAPLQSSNQRALLEQVHHHWLGSPQRRHTRSESAAECQVVVGLVAIHAHLLGLDGQPRPAQMLDCSAGGARLHCQDDNAGLLQIGQLLLLLGSNGSSTLALLRWRHSNTRGLHCGLRYLKGLPRPVWLRRAPTAQSHPAVLQSTPATGNGWQHGLWLSSGQFSEGENLWLQLASVNNQRMIPLPAANLSTPWVCRHPLSIG